MKVLLINGSPRQNGCTFTALSEVAKALNKSDIQTETIHVGNADIRGCTACGNCKKTGKCVFDDMVNEVAATLPQYDGIVVGSPVYYASPNGGMLSFLDRMFYSSPAVDKRMMVGASVVSARRAGCSSSLDVLNKYFSLAGMPIAGSNYWNMVHGSKPEDVLKDEEGLQIMRVLGEHMAFLIKSIALGKAQFGLPQKENRIMTNFIR